MKAMILAAGLGTRLKPFTDKHPKALAIVNGKTLLQRNIEYLNSYGFKDIIINVHHFADQIIQHLKKNNGFGSRITVSDETEEVLETGGGIKKAAWFFETDQEPFLVMNADILTDLHLKEMWQYHQKHHSLVSLAVSERYTSRYFLFNDEGILCGWRNVKTGEERLSRTADHFHQKAFSGIQMISPEIFPLIRQKGKFSMVDVYLDLAKNQQIRSFEYRDVKFIDVGKPESLLLAAQMFE